MMRVAPILMLGRGVHRFGYRAIPRLRGWLFSVLLGVDVRRAGVHVKLRGVHLLVVGRNLQLGDHCWIEAVSSYAGRHYQPRLIIGDDVAISDLTHISCAAEIFIGDGCLLGSKIYVGDHSHGATEWLTDAQLRTPPGERSLENLRPIHIGAACWIGDGAVILGGSSLAAGCIVAANSVVRLQCSRPAMIGGVPARVIRYLDASVARGYKAETS